MTDDNSKTPTLEGQRVMAKATGATISEVLTDFQPLLDKHDPSILVMAFLSMVFLIQHPDIEPPELAMGVKETSRFVCDYLDALVEPKADPSQVN